MLRDEAAPGSSSTAVPAFAQRLDAVAASIVRGAPRREFGRIELHPVLPVRLAGGRHQLLNGAPARICRDRRAPQ